ncbi:MAG: DUF4293 domain-containing protein [Bacteroidia bacterium]|jgi:hypothetical protein|nr:DUF4293 domain-containing protein [Bacteroidia bacterium]
MIQRVQSLYLLGIIIFALLTCTGQFIDYQVRMAPGTATIEGTNDTVQVNGKAVSYTLNAIYFNTYTNGVLSESKIQYGLILIVSILVGWTLNVIFGYKNRKKQMLHVKINFVIILAYLSAIIGKAFTQIPDFSFSNMTIKASVGLAMIMFMLYLNFRAFIFIRRDEELVRSADRLR